MLRTHAVTCTAIVTLALLPASSCRSSRDETAEKEGAQAETEAAADEGRTEPTADPAATSDSPGAPAPADPPASTDPAPSEVAVGTGEIPYYFDRPVTDADLEGRTLRELSIMRNTIFARAGNPFRKQWLNAYFTAQPWYRRAGELDEDALSQLDWHNARRIGAYETSLSKDALERRAATLRKRPEARQPGSDVAIELDLISTRLGRWSGATEVARAKRSPLEDPGLLDRQLTLAQLEAMSRRDLRILRNTIYARRGYVFKSDVLTDYFSYMDWYQPDEGYSDDRLSKIDWRNIKLIRSVEDSIGGPLSEAEHAEEWFGAA